MALNEREQAAFDAIATQLAEDDPNFSSRAARAARRAPSARVPRRNLALVVMGLLALPVAADTGFYVIGLLGFLAAALGVVGLLRRANKAPADKPALIDVDGQPRPSANARGTAVVEDFVTRRSHLDRWQLIVIVVIAVFMVATVLG